MPNTLKVWPLQVSVHWFPPNSLDLPWLHFQLLLQHMEDLSRKPSIPRFQKEPKPTAKRFVAPAGQLSLGPSNLRVPKVASSMWVPLLLASLVRFRYMFSPADFIQHRFEKC